MRAKKVLALAVSAVLAVGMLSGCGGEKAYPSKNVSVIVPFGAGGNTDMSIRALLNTATEKVDDKYTFVVENKTGNAGLVGMEALANSDADGYTLGATCIDLMLHMCFGRTETTMDDYIPIACTMADPYGLVVSASSPNYKTLEEFVDYAKANPGKVKVGDSGAGAAPNVAAKAFEMYFGVQFDIYSYDGSADCVTAIENGEIDATFTQPSPAVASLKAGTLSMLGVLANERLAAAAQSLSLLLGAAHLLGSGVQPLFVIAAQVQHGLAHVVRLVSAKPRLAHAALLDVLVNVDGSHRDPPQPQTYVYLFNIIKHNAPCGKQIRQNIVSCYV